jgi:hypothetical protein
MKLKATAQICSLCCLLVQARAYAHDWVPSKALLDAVRRVESADGLLTVGDNGLSLGNYQLSESAWVDVNSWRKTRGKVTFNYEKKVWSEQVSRSYAADYLTILHTRLEKHLRRCPNSAELYAAYNMGLCCFARGHFRVRSSHKATAEQERWFARHSASAPGNLQSDLALAQMR